MTTPAERNNPEYWRKRAEQIRAKAQTMTVPCDADMLYEIAKEYEFIAELTERLPQPKT